MSPAATSPAAYVKTAFPERLALVLGGGGLKGFAHIGLLRAFEDERQSLGEGRLDVCGGRGGCGRHQNCSLADYSTREQRVIGRWFLVIGDAKNQEPTTND